MTLKEAFPILFCSVVTHMNFYGDGNLCLFLQGVLFSENETGRGGQVVAGPGQKRVVWC
jgi:hypothetical protein